MASATDASAAVATRKVSLAALDALSSDPELLARTCDCKLGGSTKATTKEGGGKAPGTPDDDADAGGGETEI